MTRFTFMSHHLRTDGYGIAGMQTAAALTALGADVDVVDMVHNGVRGPRALERQWSVPGPAVAMCVPLWWPRIQVDGRLVGFTMAESTKLPPRRAEMINETSAMCLVPCNWNARVFAANGVTVPIRVAPLGVNPADWFPLNRTRNGQPYRFLWAGTPDKRKGWDLVYRAFRQAFGDRKDVELVLHFRKFPRGLGGCADANVRLVQGMRRMSEMRQMMHEADCYVFPSRGEGWGLPPREAAATGLPVIATDWGGLAEDIRQWALPLRVRYLSTAEYGEWDAGTIGEWAEPDFEHLVELMLWCARERSSAAEIGRHGSEWLTRRGTWQNTALAVMGAVREVQGC